MTPLLVFLALGAAANRGLWGYLLRHPAAFDGRSLLALFRHAALPLAATAAFALAAWGLGRLVLRRLRVPAGPLDDAYALALGLGACASSLFLLGLAGALSPAGLCLAAASWMALSLPGLLPGLASWSRADGSWRRHFRALWRGRPRADGSRRSHLRPLWRGLLAGLLGYAAWHALVSALAPPTQWDALAYHLAIPKIYVAWEKIAEIPWLVHSHWPHLLEALYAAPLAAGLENAPALVHAGLCGLLVWAVLASGRSELDEPAAILAAAILACQPVLLKIAGTPHSDGALAVFHFLGCLALWSWSRTQAQGLLPLAGLLGGLAAAAKLHGAALLAFWSLWVWARAGKERRWRAVDRAITRGSAASESRWRAVGLYLGSGLLVVAPWYLKTWYGAANPVWPFFSNRLGGLWGGESVEAYSDRFNYAGFSDLPGLLRYNGPLFLLVPFLGLSLLARARGLAWPGFLKFLLLPALPYLLLVGRRSEAWRYLLPFAPALALASAWWASRLFKGRTMAKAAAAGLCALALSPVLSTSQNNQLFPVLGLRSASRPAEDPRRLYLERTLDHYRFYESARRLLRARPSSRLLLFREIRGYYLDADYLWGDPANQGLIRYLEIPDAAALRRRLSELGVTHVLVNEALGMYQPGQGYYERPVVDLMENMLRLHARALLREGGLALFELL